MTLSAKKPAAPGSSSRIRRCSPGGRTPQGELAYRLTSRQVEADEVLFEAR